MRLMLIGFVVGGAAGLLVQKYVLEEESGGSRILRNTETSEAGPRDKGAARDAAALLARIRELEALLAARPDAAAEAFGSVPVPTTEEGIDLLMEEFTQTDDLDRLLALIEALLLQGEKGYPKLTSLLARIAGKAMANRFKEEDLLQRVIPALKLGLRHERALVGYVGYLLTAENVPGVMRTGAMAAAMFLSVNGTKGSEAFGGKLLEQFLATAEAPAQGGLFAGMGREQGRLLIEAMGFLKQREAVDPLLRMLSDPAQEDKSWQIISALGRIGDPRAVGPLAARMRTRNDPNSWWTPEVSALARIGTPEALQAAEEYIRGITDEGRFFNQAGSYLRERPSPVMVALVRDRFRANTNTSSIWNALYGLRQVGTPEALAVIDEIATTAGQEQIRMQARRILEERRSMAEGIPDSER